jgi:hypothetical protein
MYISVFNVKRVPLLMHSTHYNPLSGFVGMFCRSLFLLLYFFLLPIVLSVFLRYTDSDYPFGICKLFYIEKLNNHMEV